MSTVARKPWVGEELVRLPEGWRYEIDEGELVIMAPAGFEHGRILSLVDALLRAFVQAHRLGEVVSGDVGIFLGRGPDTLRAPDVAFYSRERLQQIRDRTGFPQVAPDLAVEVHDPTEPDLTRKVHQYLQAGVRAVWVVDPQVRSLTRYAPGEQATVWSDPADVVEEPVLPGFRFHLREVFGN
ncbi:MAG: Uma2 family endonuclease [Armatimonadota bacterium]|nr:Uma2 family endonuclease [Armatimonadota bacterium]MDR7397444.1 Uma2 family endonuclease [Armatimonadota bacterium]MDR7400410.1 Uma2 family endonuclease [Armatimonadota bacterium]MDR7406959.1 Uma2 family endonuclease [Armatimonadota bacterium]MDR7430844.1 Uma2 family endonuclease [Armatimonadota bacterium]